jgi:hypothetical protein
MTAITIIIIIIIIKFYFNLNHFSINAIGSNGCNCKYVETFTHRHVGSTGTPSRRTVFVRGTSAEHRESPEIARRNTKANIL